MKAKEYLLLAIILLAGLIAVLLPIIASGSWTQELYDADLSLPNARENLLTSIIGAKWQSAPASSTTPSMPNQGATASPAAVPSATSIQSTSSTFTLNLTPVTRTPTAVPTLPRATRQSGEESANRSSPMPFPTNPQPTNPAATNAPPTDPAPTNAPPTSAPPTNPPPTDRPIILPPIISTLLPFP